VCVLQTDECAMGALCSRMMAENLLIAKWVEITDLLKQMQIGMLAFRVYVRAAN